MHLILTGATGLVGSSVLHSMLQTSSITKISILSRSPVAQATAANDPRVTVIQHSDFSSYPASVLDQLRGADGCVWALGISQTKVSAADYVAITKDYTLAAADAFSNLGGKQPFRFIYVSGEGATQTPGRFSAIFARVKGQTESALADLTSDRLQADSVRPAFVDAAAHTAIKPYIPDPGVLYRSGMVFLGPVIRTGFKSMHSPTEALGTFLTKMAMGSVDDKLEGNGVFKIGKSRVVENVGIRRIMDL